MALDVADTESPSRVTTGAEALVRWLEAEGVEVVFGCCGHGNIGFLDALIDSKITYVTSPHEQIAFQAADAYFRVTHRLGVVTTTMGPGMGSILNGVMDASADCSRVLVISGDTIRDYEGLDSFQEVTRLSDAGQADVFRPVMKRVFQVRHPHMVLNAAARAMNYALAGAPGPVMLSIAMDLFTYADDFGDIAQFRNRWPTTRRVSAPQEEVQRILSILAEAEFPTVFAGGGVLLSEATAELVRFAEHFQTPVVTSMIGQSSFPNSHPLYAGNAGSVGTPTATWALQSADVLVAVGTRFGEIDCSSWLPEHFIRRDCRVIQIDIDPIEVGKTFPVAAGVVGDAQAVLAQIVDAAGSHEVATESRVVDLGRRRAEWLEAYEQAAVGALDVAPLEIETLLYEVQRALPDKAVILAGSGVRHQIGQYYQFTLPGTHLVASGHGTMGWVTAATLGAKIGRPDVLVVGLVGDGDFRSLSETVGVAVEANTAPIWLILNNASYNVIGLYQKRHYGRLLGTNFEISGRGEPYSPDYAQLAEAYGALGLRVATAAEVEPVLHEAIASRRPVVIDAPVTTTPRYRAAGYWDANSYLAKGWNQATENVE
jgi:acetolactate synthase-1/2/3 large subunit